MLQSPDRCPHAPQLQSPAVREGKPGHHWQKGDPVAEGEASGGVAERRPRCGGAVVSLCKAAHRSRTPPHAAARAAPSGVEEPLQSEEKTLLFMNYCRVFFLP